MYGTVDAADAYHAARGNAGWSGTTDEKAAALLRASEWLDGTYALRFPGSPAGGATQEREWPRTGAADVYGNSIPADEVPIRVERATYEAALREIGTPNSLTPDFSRVDQVTREKVGPIEREYALPSSAEAMQPVLATVDQMLKPLLLELRNLPAMMVV